MYRTTDDKKTPPPLWAPLLVGTTWVPPLLPPLPPRWRPCPLKPTRW